MNRITDLVKSKTEAEYEEKYKLLEGMDKETFTKEFLESLHENIGKKIETLEEIIRLKIALKEITQIVSRSYNAETYFGQPEAWLSQRINGRVENGNPISLNSEEKEILQRAFKEISEKVGAVSVG